MRAACAGSLACVSLLLERGAPWNALDRAGRCAGEYAMEASSQGCCDALVAAGVRAQMLFSLLDETGAPNRATTDDRTGHSNKAPVRELSEFSLGLSHNTRFYRELRSAKRASPNNLLNLYPQKTGAEYLASAASFDAAGETLLDANGDAVMMEWERPLMEAHADVLVGRFPHEFCEATAARGARQELDVLNVGHGLGIIDGFLCDRSPSIRSHTICEAHPDVLARLAEQGWRDRAGVRVVGTTWQAALADPSFGPFDAIFFDTYAETYADMRAFFDALPRLLRRPHGTFSFFNGMCPFNVFFHGVAAEFVKVELAQRGLATDFVPLQVNDLDATHTWQGVKRRYWQFDSYHLPISRWLETTTSVVQDAAAADDENA